MDASSLQDIVASIRKGQAVPYLGPGTLAEVRHDETGAPLPATSDELILALNNGQPMAPKLMYEFPRAAMHVELKRGRAQVTKFLTATYGADHWTRSPFHAWLRKQNPGYVIDTNRDTQLQRLFARSPHTLVVGVARLGGSEFRYRLWSHDGTHYAPATEDQIDTAVPVLFKPHGTPIPEPTYIASDADYVDYITELMGGFAIPDFLKRRRRGLKYVLLGMRLNRDTERMVLSEMIFGSAQPAGWALIPEPSAKEARFCERLGLKVVDAGPLALLEAAAVAA